MGTQARLNAQTVSRGWGEFLRVSVVSAFTAFCSAPALTVDTAHLLCGAADTFDPEGGWFMRRCTGEPLTVLPHIRYILEALVTEKHLSLF